MLAVAGVVLAALIAIAVVLVARDSRMSQGEALARYGFAHRSKGKYVADEAGSRHGGEGAGEAATEKDKGESSDKRRAVARIKGRDGGEGSRHGGKTPWAEAVANRAYPRSYVDDRLARKEARAFKGIPQKAPRSSFPSSSRYQRAVAAAPGAWTNLGPSTPNVSAEASQFFDPTTQTGPTTQESGRVSAIAVDPACAPGDCRVWLATAGGGIWRTNDALAAHPDWIAPPDDLPTNAFGSIIYDAASNTVYAGSGEPNGSSDSEAGLGLFKSTDGGATWSQVGDSADVATNRAIGGIAVTGNTIYIGTAVARHGASSTTSGRRTPPGAPTLGVYKSVNGGPFTLQQDLSDKTPADPTPPSTGSDFFAGGINRIEIDPNDPSSVYAAVLGYGLWRSADGGANWTQVFHTINQDDFTAGTGDSTGDITAFDLVDLGTKTRAYLGDASDDYATDGDPATPDPQVYRNDDVAAIPGDPTGASPANAAWTELSNPVNGTAGYPAYGWCQNGQCSYDAFVVSPAGHPNEVWLGGSMNYDELPAYAGQPPRSNGRGVIRSTNANGTSATTTWQDMTVKLADDSAWKPVSGLHPDMHGIGFSADGSRALEISDGGIYRIDVSTTEDHQGSCDNRRYVYDANVGPESLTPADLADCKELLAATPSAVTPINDGLADLQFQSISFNPQDPQGELLGGTQDNGTWSFTGSPAWLESVGGDGGQSGFNPGSPTIRYHNYYDATPEVNFHGNDPKTWLDIYDPLQATSENRGFYVPFIADPKTPNRMYVGLESVWRTDDNGGNEADLVTDCNAAHLNPDRANPCGDWVQIGPNLTTRSFGSDRTGQYVVETQRAEGDAGTLWAATRTGRVFVTSNADADPGDVRFTRIDDDATTPGRFPSGISVDPSDPNHAFVSYSGYEAYTPGQPGHVFEVTFDPATRKAQWVDRSYNITTTANPTGADQPVTGVQYDAGTGDVYASTDFGVLRLPKGASSWEQAASGMPTVAVSGLTISHGGRVLYAATHGRSVYALRLAPASNTGGGGGGGGGGDTGTGGTPQGTPAPPGQAPRIGRLSGKRSKRRSVAVTVGVARTASLKLTIRDQKGHTIGRRTVKVKRDDLLKLHVSVKPRARVTGRTRWRVGATATGATGRAAKSARFRARR